MSIIPSLGVPFFRSVDFFVGVDHDRIDSEILADGVLLVVDTPGDV